MLIPGVDFTTIAKIANAYFKCVNDNGGIHNRPIKYIQYTEQLNPAQQSTLARKLIESDKVVGIVGNTSFTECGTNWAYYKQKKFTVVGAGVQAECFGKPSIVESNMGPRYSNVGAAQALLKRGAKTLVVASPSTISAYADGGVLKLAKQHHVKGVRVPVVLPVTDANSIITHLYQEAGNGGGIILDFTPDTAPALLQAAIAQGLVNKVKWGSSTPIANEFMAKQFGQFDNKIFINQEFSNLTKKGPDSNLWRAINKKYAPKVALQAFGQMGYMDAKFATLALLKIKGPVTAKSYNNSVPDPEERPHRHPLQALVCREPALPHSEQLRRDRDLRQRQDRREGQVLRDCAGRRVARADPEVGEAAQAQHAVGEKETRPAKLIRTPAVAMSSVRRLLGVRRRLGVPEAVHRARPRAGRACTRSRGRHRRALQGDRRAEPRVRRGRPAAGALIAYWMVNHTGWPHWLAYTTCVAFGGVVNLLYGVVFGPAFAKREPLVKMMGTLALALILLGIMAWRAPAGGAFVRVLTLPSPRTTTASSARG